MDNKKKTSLLDLARASENRVKNTLSENTETVERDMTSEKKDIQPAKETNLNIDSFDKYFTTNNDYGVGDLNMKIPISIHKKFKLIAAHTGVPMAKIVSNVLHQFLDENEKQINKILKG